MIVIVRALIFLFRSRVHKPFGGIKGNASFVEGSHKG